jgi:hypothetical protein
MLIPTMVLYPPYPLILYPRLLMLISTLFLIFILRSTPCTASALVALLPLS